MVEQGTIHFSAVQAMNCDDAAREGLQYLGKGPHWVAGEHNRAGLPEGYLESRAERVEFLSAAAAKIVGVKHTAVSE